MLLSQKGTWKHGIHSFIHGITRYSFIRLILQVRGQTSFVLLPAG